MDNQSTINSQQPPLQKVYQQDIIPGAVKPRHLVVPLNPQKGDMFYSDGTNFIKLSPGKVGQVLIISNGIPTWTYLVLSGLAANRPSSGQFVGQQYLNTDTPSLSVWIGASWKSTSLS